MTAEQDTPAWLSRMEQANDRDGYHCSGFAANATAKEYRRLQEENAKIRAALENIIEHQTIVAGPSAVKFSGTAAIARKVLGQ